jgi:hypothetical protein
MLAADTNWMDFRQAKQPATRKTIMGKKAYIHQQLIRPYSVRRQSPL